MSDTASFPSPAQRDTLFRAFLVVRDHYPRWNSVAYQQEVLFYERTQVQRHLRQLQQQFIQGQRQLDSLRTGAQAWAATASFHQAVQAGEAAQATQRWVQAEVYLARGLALHPTDAALRARHAQVSELCLWFYFTRLVRASQRVREQAPTSTTRPLRREPVYCAAQPQAAYYLECARADYAALTLGGQPTYLYKQIDCYELAEELLPCLRGLAYAQQTAELLEAYSQCYGHDSNWRDIQNQFRHIQQRPRAYRD